MVQVLGVFYEHPHWFKPLFQALERRHLPVQLWHADEHILDFGADGTALRGERAPRLPSLIFNRMSPSAWQRQRSAALQYTTAALAAWESHGVRVINGSVAWSYEVSKAKQVALIQRLGLAVPRTVVVHMPAQLVDAAARLTAPFVVKPNVGGSGAGIQRFDSVAELRDAVVSGRIAASPDGVLLLQEFHPPEENCIYRVETLAGRFLYGIRIGLTPGAGFDLCPADICRTSSGVALTTEACPVEARKLGLDVAVHHPAAAVTSAVEQLAQAAGIDVGGIEFLRSARDGQLYYYDINALSNFVSGPEQLLGFDPTERLVDALVRWLPPLAATGGRA